MNKITVHYNFPIPRLYGVTTVSKIDLKVEYHQIMLRSTGEWEMTFKTCEGLYEWLVTPFDLSNAFSIFMCLMNETLCPFIDYYEVYFDDILAYSKGVDNHVEDLSRVLTKLREERLYADVSKCYFFVSKVIFLRYEVSKAGLSFDLTKLKL